MTEEGTERWVLLTSACKVAISLSRPDMVKTDKLAIKLVFIIESRHGYSKCDNLKNNREKSEIKLNIGELYDISGY